MDQRYLWGKLLQAVRRGEFMPRSERLQLLDYVLESTSDPVVIEYAYRMVRGHLALNDVESHVDVAFDFDEKNLAKKPAVLHRISTALIKGTQRVKDIFQRR